jgi:hypothetical protein
MDLRTTLSNQLWGPALWKFLHTLTEKIGTVPFHPSEEQLWIGLLNNLRYTLPCSTCRAHYSTFVSMHAFPKIQREIVRRWMYQLHSWVNELLKKPNVPYEELEHIYGHPLLLSDEFQLLSVQGELAVRLRICSQSHITEMLHLLTQLQLFYQR